MKKADPFSGIPAVPNSLAGQWLAFNHMANHYRKLLNVKSRVDSSAPKNPSKTVQSPLSPYIEAIKKPKKLTTQKSSIKQGAVPIAKKSIKNIETSVRSGFYSEGSSNIDSPESSPRSPILCNNSSHLNSTTNTTTTKRLRPKTTKTVKKIPPSSRDFNCQANDYQIVFGPTSLKSSTDALGSDCESQSDKPRVETMGVAEKIKVFLDQMHEYDETSTLSPKKKNTLKKTKQSKSVICNNNNNGNCNTNAITTNSQSQTTTNLIEARLSRHSKCFLPNCDCANSSPKKILKKKPLQKASTNSNQTPTKSAKDVKNKANLKKSSEKSFTTIVKSTKSCKQVIGGSESQSQCKSRIGTGEKKKRYISCDSIGSVGTIHGSEDLTAEDMLMIPLSENFYSSHRELETSHSRSVNKVQSISNNIRNRNASGPEKKPQGILRSRTSSASAGYGSNSKGTTVTSLLSSLGVINNKDSSRDSAYGFSSGESRITTRESTPEKMKATSLHHHKPKSRKSTGDAKNKSLSTVASSANLSPNRSGMKMSKEEIDLLSEPSEDRYLNFLTDVTEDIVNRGIYTNKGLKILFKAHLEDHLGLDPEKMTEMLDKLRMDLGIPKDDTLNKLEFGYGSVLYSTDSYSYSNGIRPENSNQKLSSDEKLSPSPADQLYTRSSMKRDRIRSLDKRALIEESNSSSERNDNGSEMDIRSGSDMSLSDRELKLTLKEVGIDSETTLEILEIMNHSKSTKKYHHVSSDDYSNSCQPKPTRMKSSSNMRRGSLTNDDPRGRTSFRSASPPSRCSTTTSS